MTTKHKPADPCRKGGYYIVTLAVHGCESKYQFRLLRNARRFMRAEAGVVARHGYSKWGHDGASAVLVTLDWIPNQRTLRSKVAKGER